MHVSNFNFDIRNSGIEGAVEKEISVNLVDDAVKRIIEENSESFKGKDADPNDVKDLLIPYTEDRVSEEFGKLSAAKQVDSEVINARGSYSLLRERLDTEKSNINKKFEAIEIEPDDLKVTGLETDAELVQKAIDLAETTGRNNVSIKLGRIYEINTSILLNVSISYKKASHLFIKGYNGGFKLIGDSFLFDGIKNSGGINFQDVKFIGSDTIVHALFNCDNLIQLTFKSCQFIATNTILYADTTNGYIQSCKFLNCNFKGMENHQIVAAMVYDMDLTGNFVEWGVGGLIRLTQPSTDQYCSIKLTIKDNVIEGISEQIPIVLTHVGRGNISDNYFEGNSFTDIDLSGALIPHRSLTITNNSFGNFPTTDKTCSVKIGKLYSTQGYDFSSNFGVKTIFDFTGSNANRINLTGGKFLVSGQLSFVGIPESHVFTSETIKPNARKELTKRNGNFEFKISGSIKTLLNKKFNVELTYNRTQSTLYTHKYYGVLTFITGYDSASGSVVIKPIFIPTLSYSNQNLTLNTDAQSLSVVLLSNDKNVIKITSLEQEINDTIVFKDTAASTNGANTGYVTDVDNLISNT